MFFVGSVAGFERKLVDQSAIPFESYDEVQAGPLHGVKPLRALISISKLMLGTLQSLGIMLRRRPQAILLTGGWVNVPVAFGAWVTRVPIIVYLPDIEPGLTIRALRFFAKKIAITVPESAQYFHEEQTIVTGYPLRQHLLEAKRESAIAKLGLDPSRKTILVFGGSRGAQALNIALVKVLPALLDDGFQVVHITGELDWERVQSDVQQIDDQTHYHGYPYLHDAMADALVSADVIVCRAGASALGELPFFRVPSILVPYPHAWRYQKINADYLADRGAAIRMNEETLAQELLPTIRLILQDEAQYSAMQEHAEALAVDDGAEQIAAVLVRFARS